MRATLILMLLAAGCGAETPPDDAPVTGRASDVAAPVENSAVDPVVDDNPAAPSARVAPSTDGIVVLTNEPFLQARIGRTSILVSGVGVTERSLPIVARSRDNAGRHWVARQDGDTVHATVIDRSCEDDMSAARFPLSGTLTIDSRTASGCARPAATTPLEADKAATITIPPVYRGRWAPDAVACRNPASSIEGLTVSPRELRFHESIGLVTAIEPVVPQSIRVSSDFTGEGQSWTRAHLFRLSPNGERLTVESQGSSFTRIKCR